MFFNPNLKTTALLIGIAKQVDNGDVLAICNQKGVDDDPNLAKYATPNNIVTRQVFKVQSLKELPPGVSNKDDMRKQKKSKKGAMENAPRNGGHNDDAHAEGNAKNMAKGKAKSGYKDRCTNG